MLYDGIEFKNLLPGLSPTFAEVSVVLPFETILAMFIIGYTTFLGVI